MNKIFKVIWNEARNAYVVVSEIAKNHGSKSCSTKKLLAMLIATGVMTCAGMAPAMAQPVAGKTNDFQYVALKAAAFAEGEPTRWNRDSWNKDFTSLKDAKTEWNAQRKDGQKPLGDYTYKYDAKNGYWVREGYVLTVDENGGKYTPLSENAIRADVAYTGTSVPEGILQSVTSTVAHNGVVTHSGDSLQKITAGSYAGVSHGGGTEVAGSWNYIINDSSWEKDGYVDLIGNNMSRGFKTTDSGLEWDEAKQTYTYKGKAVDYRNMYVIEGKLGVFTNFDGSEVYTGTVYGKNNEILMTVKDNGKFYSYWAASVTDPSVTMETYPVSKYNSDLAVIDQNIKDLNKDIIKEVTLTKDTNSAIIKLVRNGGNVVDGAITVTSGGGTGGSGAAHDTFVNISNGTTKQTFATGSKVEAIVDNGATTGIKINGENYTIKSGSKVSVTQNAAEKTTIITVDGTETTITDTDTTYTEGDGIAIDKTNKNAISVKLKEDEKNLEVTEAGLALKKALTVESVKAGDFYMSTAGIGYDDKAYITISGLNANSQKITGVADGTIAEGSKDAVNGSQLNVVKETANKGWKLSIGKGEAVNVAPGEIVDFSGDDNIKVSNTGKDVKVELEKNLTGLTSVTTENAYVTNVNASNNESVTNVEYVKKQIAGVTLTEGKGISITDKKINVKLKDGEENLKVDETGLYLIKDLTGMESITGVGGGKISFATGGNVTIKDITFNNDGRIQGVAAGKDDNDAVNVGQLNKVVAAGDTDVHIKAGEYKVDDKNKVSMNLVDKAGKSQGTVTITGVAKAEDVAVVYDKNKTSLRSTNATLQTSSGKEEAVDSIALGNGASAVKGSVAIGNGAGVSVEGGVALGVGSVASTAANALGYGAAEGETGIAWKATNGAVSVGSSVEGKKITRQITNVAAGTEDTDAVNVAQLKKVSEAAASASQGWKLKTQNGNASDVKPGATVEFYGDANIQVGNNGNIVSVTLKKQLTGIQSITGEGEGAGSISFANDGIKFNNKVTIDNTGKISGVADGKISTDSTDAVNGSQLNAVKETANKGWNLSTGKGEAVNVAPGEIVDFSGDDNIKVSNTGKDVKVELEKNLTGLTSVTTENAYVTNVNASNNESVTNVEYVKKQIAGVTLTEGKGISITDKKINVKLKDGEENLKVDETGLYLRKDLTGMESITGVGGGKISFSGGNVTINHITFNNDGRIQHVANGTENTDAVNFGQLQAVKNELIASDKYTHIDTSNEYNVGANNQIKLDVLDKDGKKLDQQVVINDVAKASDVGDVSKIADDLKNGGNKPTTVVDAVNNLNNKVGDLNYVEGGKGNYVTNGETTTTSIGKLDKALKDVADTAAKQHTTVSGSGNIVVEDPTTNTDGGKNYNVKLADNITVNSVTANTFKADQTVMDKYGLKVGDKVSVTATAVTAGKTSISDEGVKVGDKTYISADGLNANGQHITNVKAGEADTDAVNYGQLKDTNNRINGVENQVISNSNRINQLGNRVNKVGAGAAALAALHPMDFDPDDKLTFSAGYGNYGGENAAAIGAYYRPDEKVMFSVGGTVGNGENMVNAGVSFALDRTNHVSNSRTALAREVIDLRGQLAVMGAKMAKMEKALGMLDETKTKLFPDIPANHWAYEYIAKLAGNGYIEGYPDGNFGGDRLMTRYEFAAMLYRAIENGAALEEKIIKEFEPELGRIRVDRISGEDGDRDKIERVRVNDTKGERDHYGNKLAK